LAKKLDWRTLLRVPEASLGSRQFFESVVQQVILLLADHYAALSRNVAFPEVAHPTLVQLRRIIKGTKVANLREDLKLLANRLQAGADVVQSQRAKLKLSPTECAGSGLASKYRALGRYQPRSSDADSPPFLFCW